MSQSDKTDTRKTLDPEKTRQSILEAALASFSERGFGATSLADVARAAGVRKSLIQYHFGSKEDLWQACLASRAKPVIEQIDRFLSGEAANLGKALEARFMLLKEHPELRRMLAWASIETVPIPSFIEERRERLLKMIEAKSRRNALPTVMLALAAMDGWFMFGGLYRRGLLPNEEGLDEQVIKLLKKMVKEA